MRTLAVVSLLALISSTAFANDRGGIPDEPETNTVVVTERGDPFWAGVAVSSAVVSVGLMSASVYYHASWRSDVDDIRVSRPTPGFITADDCGSQGIDDKNGVFTQMCNKRDRSRMLAIAGLAVVPLVVTSAYLGFFRVTKREVTSIALVPTVTTQTAGLTLDVRW